MRMGNSHTVLIHTPYSGLWRELDEVSVMRRFVREGDVVFDIGANIGLHSILLSHLIGPRGRLHTFEPNIELLPRCPPRSRICATRRCTRSPSRTRIKNRDCSFRWMT